MFMRSSNAAGKLSPGAGSAKSAELISAHENEVLALSSYITWLSEGYPVGKSIEWRGENVIPADKLIPVKKLDKKRGEALYMERCVTCHGKGGEGVEIGDKKAGPLWGSKSWNDGAGAARVYTLAGIIRYMMPYLDPGSLTDEEAQHIAAYINSKPRPKYPFKEKDYLKEKIPPDAVYYKQK
jgi:thiosulfate dehydrogenase